MFNKETTIRGVVFKGLWTAFAALIGIFAGMLLSLGSMWSSYYYYYGGIGNNVKMVLGAILLLAGIAFAFIFAVRNSNAIAKLLFNNIGEVLKHLVCVIVALDLIIVPAVGLALSISSGTINMFLISIVSMFGLIIGLMFTYAFIQMVMDLSALRKELCVDESEAYEEDFSYEVEVGCSGSCSSCGMDCDSREESENSEVETENEANTENVVEIEN